MTEQPVIGQRTYGGNVPEVRWLTGDDLCDCLFQRIGDWTNPYIGRTHRVRLCCEWGELSNPQYVQEIPAYHSENEDLYYTEPREWDGETDMPRYLWIRQVAVQMGIPVSEAREALKDQQPPKGTPRPKQAPQQRQPMSANEIIGRQLIQLEELGVQLDATIATIHMLKNGTVSLDQVELTDGGFQVNDLEQTEDKASEPMSELSA